MITGKTSSGRRPSHLTTVLRLGSALVALGLSPLVNVGAPTLAADAAIVRRIPVTVETSGHGCVSRAFTLRFARPDAHRASDEGSAVLTLDTRAVGLSGTELLTGKRGTLTLRWSADGQKRGGTWSEVEGSWSIAAGTDVCSGLLGQGRFASDPAFTAMVYRGLVIVVV